MEAILILLLVTLVAWMYGRGTGVLIEFIIIAVIIVMGVCKTNDNQQNGETTTESPKDKRRDEPTPKVKPAETKTSEAKPVMKVTVHKSQWSVSE